MLGSLPWRPLYVQQDETAPPEGWITDWALAGTILFTAAVYAWEGYLDARQARAYRITQFPAPLEAAVRQLEETSSTSKSAAKEESSKDTTTKETTTKQTTTNDETTSSNSNETSKPAAMLQQMKEKFSQAQAYGRDKMQIGRIASTYDTAESIVFLLLGFLPYLWDTSVWLCGYDPADAQQHEIRISLVFLALTTLIGTITQLPFELYTTFQVERKHGFNKQTLGLFVSDKLKSLALTAVIGSPFVALLLLIIQTSGPYFYVYVWAFLLVFSLTMMTIVPVFIMPLFNKYEPLPDGPLKTAIYALADRLEYPLQKLFVMDGSKRSSHSNAFMFGFGKNKRIVLFDTLLTQVSHDEIVAILGHELGHWKLKHTISNLVITQIYTAAAFFCFSLVYPQQAALYAAFGFTASNPPTIVALWLFFQTLWAPVDKVLSFGLTLFSRHNEFGADQFAAQLGPRFARHLQTGLCQIHLENLGAMTPDPWYSTYHYSHPPLVERLAALRCNDDKKTKVA